MLLALHGRRPRGRAVALTCTSALAIGVWGAALALSRSSGARPVPFEAEAVAAEPLPVFAVSDGVALRLPASGVIAVAFHEASYRDATALRPLGACTRCRNRWKFSPPRPRRADLTYLVTDTRGRSTPATSAADVVLPSGSRVVAPVTGTVTAVKRYRLYSRYRDVRVEIRPDTAPDRRLVMLHLAGVRLSPGDRVEASVTRVGTVRGFRFESQVDRYVRGDHPHVHMEVKDPAARRRAPKAA